MLIDTAEWRHDILEEHVEELESLWNRRLAMLRSEHADALGLQRVDARIDAHADALALAGTRALPLLEAGLCAGPHDLPLAAASALVLAREGIEACERRLVSAFVEGSASARAGFLCALELHATPMLRQALVDASRQADATVQAAVCAVAAAHRDALEKLWQAEWWRHPDPEVRSLAWRIEGRAGLGASASDYQTGVTDAHATVRCQALWAAARTSQPWLIDHLAAHAKRPLQAHWEELRLLTFLGSEHPGFALDEELGEARFGLLAGCGRAAAVESLLALMKRGSDEVSALAGRAYTRITGVDVSLPERVSLLRDGEDPDFAEQVACCDRERAEASWRELRASFGDGRWARGVNIEREPTSRWPSAIDLELRWGAQLRAASGLVVYDAEIFPFRAGAS
jgi:hypothetical protein